MNWSKNELKDFEMEELKGIDHLLALSLVLYRYITCIIKVFSKFNNKLLLCLIS